ncbi:sialate O-acetylesterase [Rubritalea profundi]|uniref:sialate O-acetylesterase n=1 Tax=Rubritalea profundi TaxID=1658618 RepID=UPI00101AE03C|nr:sialate O-acetylesterase [Rubritalea profundi]
MRLLSLLISTLFSAQLYAKEVDVYLLAGQSNMQGVGKVKNLDASQRALLPNAHFFHR